MTAATKNAINEQSVWFIGGAGDTAKPTDLLEVLRLALRPFLTNGK
jgi:hypothetical protein